LSAANATLALNSGEWFRLVLLVMLAPEMRPSGCDYEARLPLIRLSEFPGPPLGSIHFRTSARHYKFAYAGSITVF
jgi:hypothetical protein